MRSRKFNFVHASKNFMILSALLAVLGIIALSVFGLNYGIDFSSGTVIDVAAGKKISDAKLNPFLEKQRLGDYILTSSELHDTIRFKQALTAAQEKQFKTEFAKEFGENNNFEINVVDPEIAKEQQTNALIGMAIACLGIVLYVSIRFEWRFAIAAVLSLIFNAFFVISVFSVFQLEVNLPFILALLTIIGYDINDTVVIFDRIRENLRFTKLKTIEDLEQLVNQSIWQTLHRSINTVLTVLIAATCLFIFGSEAIRLFSLAMILGLICGAYTSIFIASPFWLFLRKKQPLRKVALKPQHR